MLKKVNRLAKVKDIQITFARGRTFFTPFFTLKFLPSSQETRFAVVVSNKVYKKAHDRNRLKRIIREALRKDFMDVKKGNYMVMAKPKLASLDKTKHLSAFLEVMHKLK